MKEGGFRDLNILDLTRDDSEENKFLIECEQIELRLIKNLIELRTSKQITQEELSRRSGLAQQAISRIETYGNKPNLKNLIKYLLALNVDINDIFS